MATDQFQVEEEPRPDDKAFLNDQLYRFNATATGVHDGQWLAVFVRDADGQIMAGLHGWTWGRIGYVDTFWIREDLRRQGLGTRLLAAAEGEASRRGCREMHLTTHSYQAPGFYRRWATRSSASCPAGPRVPRVSSSARRSREAHRDPDASQCARGCRRRRAPADRRASPWASWTTRWPSSAEAREGAAEAAVFAREGAKVVFGDILDAEGEKVEAAIRAEGGDAVYRHLDVTSEADWLGAVQMALGALWRPGTS